MARKSKQTSRTESDFEFDYESDLRIDSDNLYEEFLNHPLSFMKYAAASATANKLAKEADEKVKTLRSQLIKAANENPDETLGKGVKPTAPVVEAYYRDDEEYKEAKQDWVDATYNADMMVNIVFAFNARKTALEYAGRVEQREYNAEPKVSGSDATEKVDKMKKDSAQTKVKNRMNR